MAKPEILLRKIDLNGGRKLLVDPELSKMGVIDAYRFCRVGENGVEVRRTIARMNEGSDKEYNVALVTKWITARGEVCIARRLVADVTVQEVPGEGWSLSIKPRPEMLTRLLKTSFKAHTFRAGNKI